jgi:hypothetical protein
VNRVPQRSAGSIAVASFRNNFIITFVFFTD